MDGIRRRIFRRWYTCVYYAGKIHLSRGLVLEMILPAVTLSLHSWYWVIIPVELWIYGLSWRADQLLEERGHLNFDLSANHITEDEHQQAYSRYNKRLEKLRRLVDDTLIFFAVWLVLTLLLRFTHYPLEGITRFSYLAWAHSLG